MIPSTIVSLSSSSHHGRRQHNTARELLQVSFLALIFLIKHYQFTNNKFHIFTYSTLGLFPAYALHCLQGIEPERLSIHNAASLNHHSSISQHFIVYPLRQKKIINKAPHQVIRFHTSMSRIHFIIILTKKAYTLRSQAATAV